jgi:hypothetical protein
MYGFKELSMAPGFSDGSLLRERLTAELFRMGGVPAARTAFYRVYIDFGDGPEYAGLYTMVEVIDDTMIENQFGEDEGNIYKPESSWRVFIESEFKKKNNSAADFSDVQAAFDALHSPLRSSDPVAWREGLDATLDVDHFLHWLAVSNAIVNKDSYGTHPRNYYLYSHPQRGLVWIPWDHNSALNGEPGVGGGLGSEPKGGLTLVMDDVDDDWPLIRFLMDDPVYAERYRAHLAAFAEDVLSTTAPGTMISAFEALIANWVSGPDGEQEGFTQLLTPVSFPAGIADLRQHMIDRRQLVEGFLTTAN